MIITLLEVGLLITALVVLRYALACYRESRDEAINLRESGTNGVLKLLVENAVRRDQLLIGLSAASLAWAIWLVLIQSDYGLVAVSAKVLLLCILGGAWVVAARDVATRRMVLDILRRKELADANETAAGVARRGVV